MKQPEPVWRCEDCGAWLPRPEGEEEFGPSCIWCTKSIMASENRSHSKRELAPRMCPAYRAEPFYE